jgi:hypothetical protein
MHAFIHQLKIKQQQQQQKQNEFKKKMPLIRIIRHHLQVIRLIYKKKTKIKADFKHKNKKIISSFSHKN